METFDYIVCGAGSAGATLAARLAESGRHRVLLLEAGGRDWSPTIQIPGLLGSLLMGTRRNWHYMGEPDPTLGGRRLDWMAGRVTGGSSSINGMVYGRGLPADYERWVEAGNPGWGWDDMQPWFRRMESWTGQPHPLRGDDGPVSTRPFEERHPACTAAMEALVAHGVPAVADYGVGIDEGVGPTQATQRGGWRHSTARAYLAPALRKGGVTLRTGAQVSRLIVAQGRCTGVEYRHRGRLVQVGAGLEVIVSLGAIGSPALLLRSGIGPARDLEAVGVDVVHDLPGVGANLNEHVNVKVSADLAVATYNTERMGLGKLRNGLRWLVDRSGPAASPANHYQAFVKTRPGLASADVQIQIMAFAFHDDPADNHDGVTAVVSLCAPNARGKVSLANADPFARPKIAIPLLSDPEDLAALIRGCRLARRILEDGPAATFAGRIAYPSPQTESDEDWTAFIRRTAGLNWHPTSTCRMGPGPDDVVDSQVRVHGIDGLRICDASIFPNVTSGNTNAPVIAVAEKAAALILERAA
ncbi:GMC family oxidoreductase [Novosphingobium sp. BL-52-GroH]|uniref:GMC family oxidoreductase n=1 Tax=Novosphingobium sp. BL-52-GroH TaxID=3349877 RepID=UPI00384DF817